MAQILLPFLEDSIHRPASVSSSVTVALVACAFAPCLSAQVPVLDAPVAPDAIYLLRTNPQIGLSIVDLNGFGGGTGAPSFDPTFQTILPGTSHCPFHAQVLLQGSLLVPLLTGPTSTLNGGSAGVFALARDSARQSLHAGSLLAQPADAMLGAPLDVLLNNGPGPFGCVLGGGSPCSSDGLQVLEVALGSGSTRLPATLGGPVVHVAVDAGNPIAFAPHPNLPPIQGPRLDGGV